MNPHNRIIVDTRMVVKYFTIVGNPQKLEKWKRVIKQNVNER